MERCRANDERRINFPLEGDSRETSCLARPNKLSFASRIEWMNIHKLKWREGGREGGRNHLSQVAGKS